jgi:hypothetical protein
MLVPAYEYKEITRVNSEYLFTTGAITYQARNLLDYLNNRHNSKSSYPDYSRLELLIKLAETCEAINHPEMWINELYQLIRATLPFLAPDELNQIWDAITPDCEQGLDNDQQRWLNLARALSQRDAEAIADNSLALLKQDNFSDLPQKRFQFASLLLALVKLQEFQAAHKLWTQFVDRLYGNEDIPLAVLMLYSLAAHQLSGNIFEIKSGINDN